jgi:hypothetical protein
MFLDRSTLFSTWKSWDVYFWRDLHIIVDLKTKTISDINYLYYIKEDYVTVTFIWQLQNYILGYILHSNPS